MSHLVIALLSILTVWHGPKPVLIRHVRDHGGEPYLASVASFAEHAAGKHGLDPYLLIALAFSESSINPDAVGPAGEIGLMQLHPQSKWGRLAANDCQHAPGFCRTWVSMWWGAAALQHGLELCGTEAAAVSWFKSGRCLDGPKGRAVVALRDRLRDAGGGA